CYASFIPLRPTPTLFPYTTLFRSLTHPQPPGQLIGLDERSKADLETHGRIPGHRQQLPVTPHGLRTRLNARMIERQFDAVVVVKDRKSTRLNSSHVEISYAVFCLK